MDFAPEHTTTAGVRAICSRSAEMSSDSAKPLCTPPIPPVAMNVIPAIRQAASVPPTVVEPRAPWTTQAAMSRAPTLRAFSPASANRSSDERSSPIRTAPSSIPTVAATAPAALTRSSDSIATASPRPPENPCETSVVSRATTGRSADSASATSSDVRSEIVTASPQSSRPPWPRPRGQGEHRRQDTPRRRRPRHPSRPPPRC
jgi:hypothetical protein